MAERTPLTALACSTLSTWTSRSRGTRRRACTGHRRALGRPALSTIRASRVASAPPAQAHGCRGRTTVAARFGRAILELGGNNAAMPVGRPGAGGAGRSLFWHCRSAVRQPASRHRARPSAADRVAEVPGACIGGPGRRHPRRSADRRSVQAHAAGTAPRPRQFVVGGDQVDVADCTEESTCDLRWCVPAQADSSSRFVRPDALRPVLRHPRRGHRPQDTYRRA